MKTTLLILAGALGAVILALATNGPAYKVAARRARALEVQNES